MLGSLKSQMTQVVTGLGLTGLADLGISVPKSTGGTTTEDAKAGKMTFDTAKFAEVLNADYTKVRDLFAGKGATKGISSADLRLRRLADRHQRRAHRSHGAATTRS